MVEVGVRQASEVRIRNYNEKKTRDGCRRGKKTRTRTRLFVYAKRGQHIEETSCSSHLAYHNTEAEAASEKSGILWAEMTNPRAHVR